MRLYVSLWPYRTIGRRARRARASEARVGADLRASRSSRASRFTLMSSTRRKRPRIFEPDSDSEEALAEKTLVPRGDGDAPSGNGAPSSVDPRPRPPCGGDGPSSPIARQPCCGDGVSSPIAPQPPPPQSISGSSWAECIKCICDPIRKPLGQQLRSLSVTTAFSGLGSIMQCLMMLGIAALESVAAETKTSAHTFCRRNNLLAEHVFEDIRSLVTSGSGRCIKHGHCHMPLGRADLCVMGFPCQPYSAARVGSVDPENIVRHKSFDLSREARRFLERTRPRAALLENVEGFANDRRGASEPSAPGCSEECLNFCENFCSDLRGIGYHVCWMRLRLEPWVAARSTRIYMFAVADDVGPEDVALRARELAEHIQTCRSERLPATLDTCYSRPGTPEWTRECTRLLPESGPRGAPPDKQDAAWKKQAAAMRERNGWRGNPWTQVDSPPLLRGLSKTARVEEVLNLGFFWGAQLLGLDPHCASHRPSIAKQLICDPSQNPGRHPWGLCLRRLTRGSRPYIYAEDRCMFPLEAYRVYGWESPTLDGLTDDEAWDLLGDSMALQTLGVAASGLLLSLGERLPGLWRVR